ncbi:MAG: DnaJ domain-containing protein [Gammaproteobacteria bacterium]|nr:DnaJ domain-containing protein [Gammaproteobacteria bacterium]
MIREVGLIALIIGLWFGIRWLVRQPRQVQWKWMAGLAVIVLLGLAATGRLHWIFALVAAIVPFIRRVLGLISYLPMLKGLLHRFRDPPPDFSFNRQASMETRFLKVELDPASGKLCGEIKQGPHQGKKLEDLSQSELTTLLQEYSRQDPQSAQLLAAYLQRSGHTGWQDHYGQDNARRNRAGDRGTMSRQEAYAILGLNEGASENEVIEAHRRLIQKLHPDRGGNDYLSAKINQAKTRLLG